ncbi:hypothetical protein ACX5K5_03740 [Glutamicibacter bergerei]|jgi:hypothetical protein|uniref:Uncharacterized protein n=1 Tax=Glutamicibacter bergerei TaxID=256702 RepID=A0ABV9MPM1_9MICC|nr:hypothetical protein [Glutamicibacter sp. BW80]PCC30378.1 hypothetical protein CIK76_01610 [Glutamicibacter sp. BW80]HBV11188.1 hypothetical protein [Micrococcaceae bacterium]
MSQAWLVRALLRLSLFVTPAHLRQVRSEQWRADLRDCSELDIPSADVVAGALIAGTRLRIAHGLASLSNPALFKEERAMKILLPTALIASVLTLGGIAGVSAISNYEVTQITVPEGMIEENARTTPSAPMIIDGVEVLGSGEVAPTYPGE